MEKCMLLSLAYSDVDHMKQEVTQRGYEVSGYAGYVDVLDHGDNLIRVMLIQNVKSLIYDSYFQRQYPELLENLNNQAKRFGISVIPINKMEE